MFWFIFIIVIAGAAVHFYKKGDTPGVILKKLGIGVAGFFGGLIALLIGLTAANNKLVDSLNDKDNQRLLELDKLSTTELRNMIVDRRVSPSDKVKIADLLQERKKYRKY